METPTCILCDSPIGDAIERRTAAQGGPADAPPDPDTEKFLALNALCPHCIALVLPARQRRLAEARQRRGETTEKDASQQTADTQDR